jgi:phenylpropionate dioxygenase-like ring-hydroxylating dioxygenase large terminal subunit
MSGAAPFLRNAWYMAGWSDEVGDALLRRRLLGDPVLLFRKEDGGIAAMTDRCPHRFAPLSMGTRSGDTITCAYHGLQFDAGGACVGNPFSDKLPKSRVRTFPAVERDGIVWFWPGAPGCADEALIPDFSALFVQGLGDPLTGLLPMNAPYEFGTDNLMDLSHIEFVHKGSFAGRGVIFAGEHEVVTEGRRLHSNWWMPGVPAPGHTYGIYPPNMQTDHWLEMRWDPPASMLLEIGACPTGGDRAGGVIVQQAHILTPETAETTHYFWATTRPGPSSAEGDRMLADLMGQAFREEDKPIIEAAYANLDGADFWDAGPISLQVDGGGTRARRMIQKLVKEEEAAS